ncbi:hypothetical protein SAMN05192543_104577 [Paraburkholderia megapolitana]|uniref:Uncharacterized protein n=1 Tax=Paraburkholderia megapolitana TaxID=420953 RepID=A0A1I3LUJ4_9BURK|nr:hypothetical protein SAMN05192543_104577 [Paraburkholderia megapolitana]
MSSVKDVFVKAGAWVNNRAESWYRWSPAKIQSAGKSRLCRSHLSITGPTHRTGHSYLAIDADARRAGG